MVVGKESRNVGRGGRSVAGLPGLGSIFDERNG